MRHRSLLRLLLFGIPVFLAPLISGAQGIQTKIAPQGGYVKNQNNPRVIIFVHGLFSGPDAWRCDEEHYWPAMIASDQSPAFANTDIYVVGYPTPTKHGKMTISDLITVIMNHLESDGVFESHKEVVFVAHSLGGILTQQLLLTYRDKQLYKKVSFIYLFGTPLEGSKVADIGKIFYSDPLVKELQTGEGNFVLPDMDEKWIHAGFDSIHRYCAYETQAEGIFKVVNRQSATRGCQDTVAIPGNHRQIVKPCNTSAEGYIALKNKLETVHLAQTTEVGSTGTAYAPYGIAITGGLVENPTVNNYGSVAPPDRNITVEAGTAAVAILKRAAADKMVVLEPVGMNNEIDKFSRQIWQVFVDGGWTVTPQASQNLYLTYEVPNGFRQYRGEGVACYHKPDPTADIQLAIQALTAAGFPCKDIASSYASDFTIIVGNKVVPDE